MQALPVRPSGSTMWPSTTIRPRSPPARAPRSRPRTITRQPETVAPLRPTAPSAASETTSPHPAAQAGCQDQALLPPGFEQGALTWHRMEIGELAGSGGRQPDLADNDLLAAPVDVNLRQVAEENGANDPR